MLLYTFGKISPLLMNFGPIVTNATLECNSHCTEITMIQLLPLESAEPQLDELASRWFICG